MLASHFIRNFSGNSEKSYKPDGRSVGKSVYLIITQCAKMKLFYKDVANHDYRLLFPSSQPPKFLDFLGWPELFNAKHPYLMTRDTQHLAEGSHNKIPQFSNSTLFHSLFTSDVLNWMRRINTNKRKEAVYTEGSVTVDFFCCCCFNPFEQLNWEQHGGQTRTFSVPGPASSSAAVHAPLCSACWAESVNGTERCERWQKAAGPENVEWKKKGD